MGFTVWGEDAADGEDQHGQEDEGHQVLEEADGDEVLGDLADERVGLELYLQIVLEVAFALWFPPQHLLTEPLRVINHQVTLAILVPGLILESTWTL